MKRAAIIGWVLGAIAFKLITGCMVVVEGDPIPDDGPWVYACFDDAGMWGGEWCSPQTADEVSARVGLTCSITERWWPNYTHTTYGIWCLYGCEPHEGCNAKSGCLCPEAAP